MKSVVLIVIGALSVGPWPAAAQSKPVPGVLTGSLTRLGLKGAVLAHCEGSFASGRRSHAVALGETSGGKAGGRYLVVPAAGDAVELAVFADEADLSCYTPVEARALNESIQTSATISGRIVPRFDSTVVCGFVDATTARCWQYSPSERRFVIVGEWQT